MHKFNMATGSGVPDPKPPKKRAVPVKTKPPKGK